MKLITKYLLPGKKIAFFFYAAWALRRLIPRKLLIMRRRQLLSDWESRPDAEQIRERVDFYSGPTAPFRLPEDGGQKSDAPQSVSRCVEVADVRPGKFQSRYAIDAAMILDYFPSQLRVGYFQGDTLENPIFPSIAKGRRPALPGAGNAVILKLDSIRHYLNPRDNIPFSRKEPKLFFRGEIHGKPLRVDFFRKWAGNPMFDLGDTCRHHPSEWSAPFVSIPDQMRYKFILALEGNDVCSALQWIMASNCVPVMPRPTVETWLMHTRLVPGVHYIEIAPDFSDVGDKISYYIEHPEEAERISENSKAWAAQFADKQREKIIALLVMERYFRLSGQQV